MKLTSSQRLTADPLYKRAESAMIGRIVERVWSPGMRLPNEFDLAAEFGVSQGTIRKALISLERRGLLSRSPGRGTTIAKTTEQESLFAFFRLRDKSGKLAVPEPLSEQIDRRAATRSERDRFESDVREVYSLERVRQHKAAPIVLERISLPVAICAGLEDDTPLPNSLYPYFQERFGLSIMTTEESISASVAKAKEARLLRVSTGVPLLRVERRARDLSNRIVELRTSYFLTDRACYRVELARSEFLSALAGDEAE